MLCVIPVSYQFELFDWFSNEPSKKKNQSIAPILQCLLFLPRNYVRNDFAEGLKRWTRFNSAVNKVINPPALHLNKRVEKYWNIKYKFSRYVRSKLLVSRLESASSWVKQAGNNTVIARFVSPVVVHGEFGVMKESMRCVHVWWFGNWCT